MNYNSKNEEKILKAFQELEKQQLNQIEKFQHHREKITRPSRFKKKMKNQFRRIRKKTISMKRFVFQKDMFFYLSFGINSYFIQRQLNQLTEVAQKQQIEIVQIKSELKSQGQQTQFNRQWFKIVQDYYPIIIVLGTPILRQLWHSMHQAKDISEIKNNLQTVERHQGEQTILLKQNKNDLVLQTQKLQEAIETNNKTLLNEQRKIQEDLKNQITDSIRSGVSSEIVDYYRNLYQKRENLFAKAQFENQLLTQKTEIAEGEVQTLREEKSQLQKDAEKNLQEMYNLQLQSIELKSEAEQLSSKLEFQNRQADQQKTRISQLETEIIKGEASKKQAFDKVNQLQDRIRENDSQLESRQNIVNQLQQQIEQQSKESSRLQKRYHRLKQSAKASSTRSQQQFKVKEKKLKDQLNQLEASQARLNQENLNQQRLTKQSQKHKKRLLKKLSSQEERIAEQEKFLDIVNNEVEITEAKLKEEILNNANLALVKEKAYQTLNRQNNLLFDARLKDEAYQKKIAEDGEQLKMYQTAQVNFRNKMERQNAELDRSKKELQEQSADLKAKDKQLKQQKEKISDLNKKLQTRWFGKILQVAPLVSQFLDKNQKDQKAENELYVLATPGPKVIRESSEQLKFPWLHVNTDDKDGAKQFIKNAKKASRSLSKETLDSKPKSFLSKIRKI